MPPPLIGITSNQKDSNNRVEHYLAQKYTIAIIAAGGLPVILPSNLNNGHLKDLPLKLDGILFSGGVDVDPAQFNGVPHPEVNAGELERDEFEIGLVRLAAASGWPFLGICRGCQVVNVALGGSLYTHIFEQLPDAFQHDCHDKSSRAFLAHEIQLESASLLATISAKDTLKVNSLHHQGIQDLAPGLTATGWCPKDHLIEAVELQDHPFGLAVQWHPEELLDQPEVLALFTAFVRAAGKYHERTA